MENGSGGAAILTGIHTAFKFADFAVRIAEVGTENEVFVRTIRVVREDLREVERLLSDESICSRLASTAGRLSWVKGAIDSTKIALNDIGKWVERARVDQEATGSVRFETRVRWVFNDRERLLNRKSELRACHQQLSTVLTYLLRLDEVPRVPVPPTYTETILFSDILSPRQRRNNMATAQRVTGTNFEGDHPRRSDLATNNSPSVPFAQSPPPAYASAIKVDESSEPPTHEHTGYWEEDTKKSDGDPININEQFAYTAYQPVELGGSLPQLSATNALGPVNPFEFLGCIPNSIEVQKEVQKPEIRKYVAEQSVPELLGDLSFPAELPSAPVRGYPPHRHSQPAIEIDTGLIPIEIERVRSWDGTPGKYTIPRRPLPENSMYFTGQESKQWNQNTNISSNGLTAPETRPQISSYQSSPPLSLSHESPPPLPQRPELPPPLPVRHQPVRHSQSSVSLISSASSTRPGSFVAGPASGRTWSDPLMSHEVAAATQGSTFTGRGNMLQPLPQPNSAQSGRMRSQRNFMEMLRSIPDRDGL